MKDQDSTRDELLTGEPFSATDITRFKQAHDEILKLKKAVENSGEAVFITDLNGIITYVNPEFTNLYGYTSDEIIGKVTPRILKSGVMNEENYKYFWNELLNNHAVNGELINKSRDGRFLNIEGSANSILNDQNEIIGFLAIQRNITERKLADELLEESKEKYRGLSEASFESIFISENGICIEQNHTAEKVFGYTNEEAIGRPGTEWIVPEDREMVIGNILSGYDEPYEAVALRKNGTTFPCMLFAKMMHYKGRTVRVTSLSDITDRKRMEASINRQLTFSNALNDIAGVIISTDDSNAIIEKTNSILGETLAVDRCLIYDVDFSRNQLAASSEWLNAEYPDIKSTKGVYPIDMFSSGLNEMRRTGHYYISHSDDVNPLLIPDNSDKVLHGEMEIKSGLWYPFSFSADGYYLLVLNETRQKREFIKEEVDFLNSASKQVGLALEKINLLEERKVASEKVKASEQRFRNVLQDVKNIAVQGYSVDGTTQYWNKASELLYGFTAQEAIGRSLLDLIIPSEMHDHVNGAIQWMIETGQAIPSSELSLQRKDGSRVSVYSHHTLVQIPGQGAELFCIDIDLTERKLAEEKILELNRDLELRVHQRTAELEAAIKELETFSYSVSHDLKAPLRHISGLINILLEDKSKIMTSEGLGYLDIISASASDMGKLIDGILNFSRLNAIELQKKRICSSEMVQEAIKFFDSDIQNRIITFKVTQLPDIFGDEELLRQVWINLISNAIKYTMKKQEAIIEIGSVSGDGEETFFVKDNGAGFNMKHADKLFGVFKRLHLTRDFEGVGIGLANVNRIVTRHGGHCRAEGEVDTGAVFYFTLPKQVTRTTN